MSELDAKYLRKISRKPVINQRKRTFLHNGKENNRALVYLEGCNHRIVIDPRNGDGKLKTHAHCGICYRKDVLENVLADQL